jgi:hypothetical protein
MRISTHKAISAGILLIFLLLQLFQIFSCMTLKSKNTLKSENSNFNQDDISDDESSFSALLHETEEKLKIMHFNRPSGDVLEHKLNFEKFIMDRSVINTRSDSDSNTNFHSFLGLKTQTRSKTTKFSTTEKPEIFFDQNYEKHISKIPCEGEGQDPWSSTYFAMRYGMLAVRYDRTSRNTIGKWDPKREDFTYKYTYEVSKSKYQQPDEYQKMMVAGKDKETYIDEYCSPAEKWDLCFDDTSFTFTNWMRWKADQHEEDGDIPEWYGICHGWAPASYYFKRPVKPVTLICADGKKIKFLPDDIKALASQFWANAEYKTRFMGQSCPFTDPEEIEKDKKTGLYTDPQCSSIDPGAFIILLGNQMGIRKKNFVMDPLPDGEVWNQPCKSYKIKWYNLKENQDNKKLNDNIVSLKSLSKSKNNFLRLLYKDAPYEAKYVIGAFIEVIYGVETPAVKADTSNENMTEKGDFIAAVYLDSNHNIVGGKWKYNVHPNFAWKYEETVPPKGTYDDEVESFNGSVEDIRKIAPIVKKAALEGQPLLKVIQYLIDESSKVDENIKVANVDVRKN